MKYAIVITDGAAGWPVPAWDDKTTLEAAYLPNIDALARQGILGMAETVPPQLEASSSVACTSIVGYDPSENEIGRGAIEGAALGIELAQDQIALRLNFASVDDGVMVSYSSGNIEEADASQLAQEVKAALDNDTFTLHHDTSFKNILVVTSSPEFIQSIHNATFEAAHNIADKPIAQHLASGEGAGIEALRHYMDQASAILAASEINRKRVARGALPANTAWAFWPGERPASIVPFSEKYGKRAVMSSGVGLLKGIALLCGIDFADIDGVTDGYDNDYAAQAEGCITLLDTYDVVICHVESPDTAGHDGSAAEKKCAVESIDREIVSRFRELGTTEDLRILVMPDHPTPLAIKTHSREPVPFALFGPGIDSNGGLEFTEAGARATGCVIDPGYEVMSLLLS